MSALAVATLKAGVRDETVVESMKIYVLGDQAVMARGEIGVHRQREAMAIESCQQTIAPERQGKPAAPEPRATEPIVSFSGLIGGRLLESYLGLRNREMRFISMRNSRWRMTPATRCLPDRRLSAIHRSDRLPHPLAGREHAHLSRRGIR